MAHTPRLFMWAGGKSRMIRHYAPLLPAELPPGGYAEPFAGGAALFDHLSRTRAPFRAALSDLNGEIMGLYREVRDAPDRLISNLRPYAERWAASTPADRRALYYEARSAYWAMPDGPDAVAVLYGLMRTGFNGIWQTCSASRGRFGTPVGLTDKNAPVLDEGVIRSWSARLTGADLARCGYEDAPVAERSLVFCDPPYRDSFADYGSPFGDDAQARLVTWCRALARDHGCEVWLANRDAGDGFFEDLAADARTLRFPITYTAGRRKRTQDGFEARPAVEMLMIWRPRAA